MTRHRSLVVSALLAVLGGSVTPATAQTTQPQTSTLVGAVGPGASKYYSFTPAVSGQFTATVSWEAQGATVLMVLVCGQSSTLTYGAAAGQTSRS